VLAGSLRSLRVSSIVRLTVTLYIDEKNPDQEGDLDNYVKTILDELQPSVLRGDKDIGELVVRRIGWRRKDKMTICLGWESQG
jgi:Holliday junction resolvase RusA-like endonuclease